MRRRVRTTLLQRAVIARLRQVGYNRLADMARDAWEYGEKLPILEPAESMPKNLITDLARANSQVVARED